MASPSHLKIHEVTRVSPFNNSATEFSLPLTFYDLYFLRFPAIELLLFYPISDVNSSYFSSVIVPKLKHSLSLSLSHFLPLAGIIVWPPHALKPLIKYLPNDVVSLTVAESDADFDGLSNNEIRESAASHHLIPQLMRSEDAACTAAVQITLFPNKGFSVGTSLHHAAVDGKTMAMFFNLWTHLCKEGEKDSSTFPELIPSYDRTVIKDPACWEARTLGYLRRISELILDTNVRSLTVLPTPVAPPPNSVRGTFELTGEYIEKLRQKVLHKLDSNKVDNKNELNPAKPLHLSTFVLTFAYTLVCLVKARGEETKRKVKFLFPADYRSRLNPPVPSNYFGNCIGPCEMIAEAEVFMEENGVAVVAEKISDAIKKLEKGLFGGEEKKEYDTLEAGAKRIGVTGSTRFKLYGFDFSWGRPKKVEYISNDKTGSISIAEGRDGNDGAEIGLALDPLEMNRFASLFVSGLEDL